MQEYTILFLFHFVIFSFYCNSIHTLWEIKIYCSLLKNTAPSMAAQLNIILKLLLLSLQYPLHKWLSFWKTTDTESEYKRASGLFHNHTLLLYMRER